jgi:uncharacterized cupredoxin-like copper-binding protein
VERKRWFGVIGIGVVLLALALVVAACGDGDGNGGGEVAPTATEEAHGEPTHDEGTPPEGATTVDVTLQEWAVIPNPTSVPAGSVSFEIQNVGPEAVHEFHVLKTDLAASELPVRDDGDVIEDDPSLETVGEEHDVPVGEAATLTLELEAGSYALICNIVDETDEGEPRSHYGLGMRVDFTVE